MKNGVDRNGTLRNAGIWRWPLILGISSAAGLFSALIGDDIYDVLSGCLRALPLIAIVRALRSAQ